MAAVAEMVAAVLSYREFRHMTGMGRDTFYAWLREGRLDHLLAPVPKRFSKVKVERWLAGESSRGWRAR